MRCIAIRRRLPRGPRIERAATAAALLAVAALPFDEGPKLLFTGAFTLALSIDALQWFRTRRFPFARTGLEWPVALFGAWAVASLLWAELPKDTRNLLWRDLLRGAGMFFLIAKHARGTRLGWFASAFVLGGVACAAVGLVERWGYYGVGRYRVYATFGHPNHCANLLTAALALAVARPCRRLTPQVALVGPMLATLFFTLSRGAWGGALVASFVLGWLRSRRALFVGLVLAVVVVATAWFAPRGYLGDRIRDVLTPDRFVHSLHHRPAIWAGAWRMVCERPLLGHGYGYKNFHPAWERLEDRPDALYNAAHNTPLEIAFELGVVGLLLAFWIYTIVLRRLVKAVRGDRSGVQGAVSVAVFAVVIGWSLQAFTVEHILLEQMMPIIGAWVGLGFASARSGR